MSRSRKFSKRRLWLSLLLVSASLFAIVILAANLFPSPLFNDPVSMVLLSREGELLGARIAKDEQWRFPYSEDIPEKFQTAVVLFEDKRFSRHPGVDILALARAFYLNLKNGRIVNGGSTISMQVIRLALKGGPRSYGRKIKEILLALLLEIKYSKKEILSLYAAHAPFGGNVVGLETASWRYFGRSSRRLSWAESSLLAVLPNSPSLIHPGRGRKLLKEKRDKLLSRLLESGAISSVDHELALAEPLPEKPRSLPDLAPHLTSTLYQKQHSSGGPPTSSLLTTSLRRDIQIKLLEVIRRRSQILRRRGIGNAAALVLDNETFQVLGYVGNVFPDKNEHGSHVDIIQSPRSSGSILKPFLFAAMLGDGEILPKTLVPDVPAKYGDLTPLNYDRKHRGAVAAETALAKSLNIPAVHLLRQYGAGRFYRFLKQMGMTTLHRSVEDYGLSLILGGAEATLWEVTAMHANLAYILNEAERDPFVSDLYYKKPTALLKREAESGNKVEISPGAAWFVARALLEATRPGDEGHWKKFSGSAKIAWKTGTSHGLRDAWAIGVAPKHTVGVWAGNADGEGRADLTGLGAAAPILFDIFSFLEGSGWFVRPDSRLKPIKVCKLSGRPAGRFCDAEVQLIPLESNYEESCPYHVLIHLDSSETWRVHSGCENIRDMRRRSWFVLPPRMEWFYRKNHAEYRRLPSYRPDCRDGAPSQNVMELIYPPEGARLYVPIQLNQKRGRIIFKAAHRDPDSAIYWHLDDQYQGATRTFHHMAFSPRPGLHKLTIVDERGNRLETSFETLGKDER